MSRIAFLNGEYLPVEQARVSIFDRAFLFGDGIYEVTAVLDRRLLDLAGHLARLRRSLAEMRIDFPTSDDELVNIHLELGRRNNLEEGLIYLQITRGTAERDFPFPADTEPTLAMFTQAKKFGESEQAKTGASVVTTPDIRWQRRDIKSTALLAQVMAKQVAADAGCLEAWMVEDGYVTEGSSSSAFIITRQREIIARPVNNQILDGITRKAVLKLAEEQDLTIVNRRFTVDEAYQAKEAFLTSASSLVMPIIKIDDRAIGDGKPGPLSLRLREQYIELAKTAEPRI
jgi:D-alanine transaminase